MTLVLDLPPEVEAQLKTTARERGLELGECALQILQAHLPEANGTAAGVPEDPTLALLRTWEAERDAMTPEERAQAQAEWETFRDNMNATRAAAGARLLYPGGQ